MSSDGASSAQNASKRKKIDIEYVRERLTAVLTEKAPSKLPTMEKILSKVAKGSVPFKTLQLEVYKKYKTAIYRTAEEAQAAASRTTKKGSSTPKAETPKTDGSKASTPKPKASTPKPKASTPKASTPKPKASTPKTSTPKTSTPKAKAKTPAAKAKEKSSSKASNENAAKKQVKKTSKKSSEKGPSRQSKAASPRKAEQKKKSESPGKLDLKKELDDESSDVSDDGDDEVDQTDQTESMPIRPNKAHDDDLLSETEEEEDFTETEEEESASEEEQIVELWEQLQGTLGDSPHPDKIIQILIRTEADLGLQPGVSPPPTPAETDSAGEVIEKPLVAMDVYRLECRVNVSMHTLVCNEYFRVRLQGSDKNKTLLILPAASARMYYAYVIAIQYLAISNREINKITLDNQFDIYAVACKLRMRDLLEECKTYIEKNLNADTFVDAVKKALTVKDINMLGSCYQWLKRNGFKKKMNAGTPRGAATPKKRRSFFSKATTEAAVSKEDIAQSAKLLYDPLTRELISPLGKSLSVDVFKVLRKYEIKTKKSYFKIGSISGKYKNLKIKDGDDGFDGMMQCTLYRRKNIHTKDGLATIFLIYDGHDKKKFLIAARILAGGRRFVISKSPTDFDVHGKNYLGECFANFLGTNFSLFDHGMDLNLVNYNPLQLTRIEHSLVMYKTNVLGRVPNSLQLILPRNPDTEQLDADFEGSHTIKQDVVTKAFKGKQLKKVYICHTRDPQWNEELEAWTMDFQGRVSLASKKNFQIVCDDFGDDVLMLFGKNQKNQFAFDFKAPLTIMQAFAVALSSFADKLAVT